MASSQKLAVVLLNLGGPSGSAAIKPFLVNFFMDPYVIPLPWPLRYVLARWIAWRRSRGAAKEAYGRLGGVSPLLANTQEQARALERLLQKQHPTARVFVSMRHWHPQAEEAAQEVAAFQPERIVLLPLYPQFSTTTTLSALHNWHAVAQKLGLKAPTAEVCCYPTQAGFIAASANLIQSVLRAAPRKTRLLFSAHGLPQRNIKRGDPYQWHCEQTAAAIIRQLNMPQLDWKLCYQSKVGRLPWLEPSLHTALEEAADDKMSVIVYPLSFVSEHVETLVEIDMDYRHRAERMGIPYFAKVPTVGTHTLFIEGLRDLVLSCLEEMPHAASPRTRNCPTRFRQCFCGVSHD